MIDRLGILFSNIYLKYMPNAFVFALLLTIITSICSFFWLDASIFEIIKSWYKGFFRLNWFCNANCIGDYNWF